MRLIAAVVLALLLVTTQGQAQAPQSPRIFGFFTMELEGSDRDPTGRRWTFDQHHFNVITIFQMTDRWRAFGEIEWEHGPALEGSGGSGAVALERGWVEYYHDDALQLKIGKFLPPFGIYNLRHDASPTFLMTFLPGPIYGKHPNTTGGSQRLYAKFGTGVQALGRLFSEHGSAQYFVYLTNGRGDQPGSQDDNASKGTGARLILSSPEESVKIGASFYSDRNGTAENTRQSTLAGDARLSFGGTRLDGEILVPWVERLDADGSLSGTSRVGLGFYLQGSHRIGDRFTPFLRYESYDGDRDLDLDREWAFVAGLNVALNSKVFLKGETHVRDFADPGEDGYRLFAFSLAAAF